MGGGGGAEGGGDDLGGDRVVGGDREGVAGVVVEPGEDLDVGAVGQAVVGEVGLPGLVGQGGLESDVGGFGALLRLRADQPGSGQVAADGGHCHADAVVVFQVSVVGVGAGVVPGGG